MVCEVRIEINQLTFSFHCSFCNKLNPDNCKSFSQAFLFIAKNRLELSVDIFIFLKQSSYCLFASFLVEFLRLTHQFQTIKKPPTNLIIVSQSCRCGKPQLHYAQFNPAFQ